MEATALGKKLFLSLFVWDCVSLYHSSDGKSSNRGWSGCDMSEMKLSSPSDGCCRHPLGVGAPALLHTVQSSPFGVDPSAQQVCSFCATPLYRLWGSRRWWAFFLLVLEVYVRRLDKVSPRNFSFSTLNCLSMYVKVLPVFLKPLINSLGLLVLRTRLLFSNQSTECASSNL